MSCFAFLFTDSVAMGEASVLDSMLTVCRGGLGDRVYPVVNAQGKSEVFSGLVDEKLRIVQGGLHSLGALYQGM